MRIDVKGRRRYGIWSGNPTGTREDITRCVHEVKGKGAWGPTENHQCYRKRGHGRDGLYCRQHAPLYVALGENE